jgi:hypothetical protein
MEEWWNVHFREKPEETKGESSSSAISSTINITLSLWNLWLHGKKALTNHLFSTKSGGRNATNTY